MKRILLLILILTALIAAGCARGPASQSTPATPAETPADGLYKGKGKVTKINNDLGSVELDHEEIPKLMPAMKMEFYVTDKAMLKNIAVGDAVTFVIEHKENTEKIAAIEKAK